MSATREAVIAALMSQNLNNGERRCVMWQFPGVCPMGDFFTALWEALKRADSENLNRLSLGFPEDAQALRDFRSGVLGAKIERFGVEF